MLEEQLVDALLSLPREARAALAVTLLRSLDPMNDQAPETTKEDESDDFDDYESEPDAATERLRARMALRHAP